jgi:TolB protein
MTRLSLLLGVLCLGIASVAAAQSGDVRIDIQTGSGRRIPILCEPMRPAGDRNASETSIPADVVLADDLEYSAVFAVTRSWVTGIAVGDAQAVVSGTWTVRGNQIRLLGEVRDLPARAAIFSREYKGSLTERRKLVHQFADDIVLQFTGTLGVASTRIAFSIVADRTKELYVMDWDGADLQPLTRDRSIAMSPSWSPEGSLILFTSYRGGTGPQIWVVPSAGGKAFLISGRSGINTTASYSPDGREIVCTLSHEGNPELYILDARGGSARRLTNNRVIDTSPTWSPTGREIAFTSDRSGGSQVYVMDREGGNIRRLTFEVENTDSPSWSPLGDRIAFVARTSSGFDIFVCRADGRDVRRVVSGGSNENPRWSPNGRHLVFASNRDGDYGLYISDIDDRPPRRLPTGGRPAASPAWSPRPGTGAGAVQTGR